MLSRFKTPFLMLATGVMLVATLVTFAQQQYDPRALTRPQAAQPSQGDADLDEFEAQWPIKVPSSQGEITIFQPQMEDLVGDVLSARAAVSVAEANREPVFGVVWFKSRIATDRVSRVVDVLDVTITQTRVPEAAPGTEQAIGDAIVRGMTQQPLELSLDQLVTMLESADLANRDSADLVNDAPKIVFVDHPAIKVQYDGEPKLIPVEKSKLQRVANTPFFVVLDPASKMYFLKGGGVWYEAQNPLGPFRRSTRVPQEAITEADEFGYKDPQEPLPAAQLDRLEIITATEPTELVWTDGAPQMGTVPGTGLLYITNTESDVFMTVDSQQTYVLISGRWYAAPNRNGPWAFVPPDKLPPDFARIPENSPRGEVLAHIAGTPQAEEAVADTYVPQTATVDRLKFEQPAIDYDGEPRFEPVTQGATISYAVNSPQSVVVVDRNYYACYNAVWYVSNSPRGRWDLCTDVPDVIYTIPPSCPIYPVRYVYVYDSTPQYVYCGYTPGYVGCYAYQGVVFYGTGHHYRPWSGSHFYARPYTFGFGARYNSYANHWGFSFGLRTGGGSIWVGYSDRSWDHRDPWFGYGGYRPVVLRQDVRRDFFRNNYRDRDWDRDRDRRGDRTNVTVINQTNNTFIRNVNVYERRNDVHREVQPRAAAVARRDVTRKADERNNVLADREGRVYRKSDDGKLEVRNNGKWNPEPRGAAVLAAEPAARPAAARVAPVAADQQDAPRVQRRPAPANAKPAEQRITRTSSPAANTLQNTAPTPQRGNTPAARGQDDRGNRGRSGEDGNAGGQGAARANRAGQAPPADERQVTPPRGQVATPDNNRGARGQAADDNAPDRGARDARGQATPTDNRGARGQTNDDAANRAGRGAQDSTLDRPTDAPRGRAPAPPAPDRNVRPAPPPPADDTPANRGNRGARGQANPPDEPPPPARTNRGNDRGNDDGNAGGQGNRGRTAAPAPSDRDIRAVDRDFQARQNAENRLRNYQRPDNTPQAAPERRGGNDDSSSRGRSGAAPDRGNQSDNAPRGRGGGNPNNRGRGE